MLLFITILAFFSFYRSSVYDTPRQIDTKVEETGQLEQETFANEEPADALIDGAKATLEADAAKSEEEKHAEAPINTPAEAQQTEEPTWPGQVLADSNPAAPSKVVVMGKMEHEDTDWVHELSDWQNAVYCVDLNASTPCPSGLKTKVNKAKEAMPYLTYIIDHYAQLPDVMAFVHAHRNGMPAAWHNDAPHHDAVRMLRDLQTDTVLERGYANLRCITEIGCPDEVQPFRSPPADDKHAEHAYPYFYAHFFDATFDEMRAEISTVATPCCAQFAVSRAQVLKRERAFYERIRSFLEQTQYDDDTSGRVMEYMWHIVFGREAVHCDELFDVSMKPCMEGDGVLTSSCAVLVQGVRALYELGPVF